MEKFHLCNNEYSFNRSFITDCTFQFHPERSPFEWKDDDTHSSIPRSPQAVGVSQAFATFFVDQGRFSLLTPRAVGVSQALQPSSSTRVGSPFSSVPRLLMSPRPLRPSTSTRVGSPALPVNSLSGLVTLFYRQDWFYNPWSRGGLKSEKLVYAHKINCTLKCPFR